MNVWNQLLHKLSTLLAADFQTVVQATCNNVTTLITPFVLIELQIYPKKIHLSPEKSFFFIKMTQELYFHVRVCHVL